MTDSRVLLREHLGADYRIERELSGGGMSQVVLATDLRHQRRVVVKLLPAGLTAAISAERFEREILMSAALQHPNIVPVLSSGRMQGVPYFIMPFIEGESVRARVRRGPMSVRETVNVLKDVSRALVFAHAQGVVHRDIKPDNVLLSTGAGAAVVTDFGVAKALTASRHGASAGPHAPGMTGAGMTIGTPAYMAPEQAAADPSVDHRADLYALGILGYEMLAGAPPFHGRTPQELLAAQMTEAPAPLYTRRYDVPRALNALLMRCLEKQPSRRPESASALLRLLEDPEVVSGAFAAAVPTRARRWRPVGIGAAALLATVAAAWWSRSGAGAAAGTPAAVALDTTSMSVAVVPLQVVGDDERTRGVAAALPPILAQALSQLPRVRVVSDASVRTLRDSVLASPVVGRRLGVTHLLEGSVQGERDQVRMTVRLVRAASDSTEWSAILTGSVDSVFAFQDRVARVLRDGIAPLRPAPRP
ncbi:MAG: protein kinase [Gemmatimonadetes bacterium]|nr:protein kinase [Gemmatimonadota bacterium]